MTERLKWTPEYPDKEPSVNLGLPNGESFEANRRTATLWTFLGRLAVYNHIHCHEMAEEGEEVAQSFYIFSHVDGYDSLARYMVENNYPMILNQTEVSSGDQDAYIRSATRDIGDYIPDEW